MTKKVTIAMAGDATLVLRAAAVIGLALTNPRSAAETILDLLLPCLTDDDGER